MHLYLREISDLRNLGLNDDPSANGVVSILSEALHWKNPSTYLTYGRWSVGGSEDWLDINRYVCFALIYN